MKKSDNKSSMQKMEEVIKSNLSDFVALFDDKLHKSINWNKKIEFLSDDLLHLMADRSVIKNKTEFTLSPKVYDTNGVLSFFIIKLNMEGEQGPQVAFSNVVAWSVFEDKYLNMTDNDEIEENEELTEEEVLANFKKLTENIKNGTMKRPENTSICSSCGRSDLQLHIVINGQQNRTDYLCPVCMSNSQKGEEKEDDLEMIEKMIARYEGLVKEYEDLIQTAEMPEVPKGLEKIAMTPLTIYRSMQAMIAELKSQRMTLLSKMDTEKKLKNELLRSIENEEYEKSAQIKKLLDKKKK